MSTLGSFAGAIAFILVGMTFVFAAGDTAMRRSHMALCVGTGVAWMWLGGTWLP